MSLLGQLQAAIEDHKYVPLAFAGTSAGGIVAALTWAGYRPQELRDEFLAMACENSSTSDDHWASHEIVVEKSPTLIDLLGPFSAPLFHLRHLKALSDDIRQAL